MAAHKSLSIATVLEKNKLGGSVPFLMIADVDVINPANGGLVEQLFFVKNNEDVLFNGILYQKSNFDVDVKEESGAQPTVTLSVADYTREIQQRLEAFGGGVGFKVVLGIIRGDSATMATDKPEIQFFFEVVSASARNYMVSFTLGAENPLSKLFPRRVQSKNFCAWRYKDATTCKYAGAMASCDFTLAGPNGCKAHGNEKNFGAFPGINNAGTRYF